MSLFPEKDEEVKLPPRPPKVSPVASSVQKTKKVTLQSILGKAKN